MSRCAKSCKVKFPQVRSVIGQYIRGEKTLQDIVHPSKLTKITNSRYESRVSKNGPMLRSQRATPQSELKHAESYSAEPIVTTLESEQEDDDEEKEEEVVDVDNCGVDIVDSGVFSKMGDSLAVGGVSLNDIDAPIWTTSTPSSSSSSATRKLINRRRSRVVKFEDGKTRIGLQAEQVAATSSSTATVTAAKTSSVGCDSEPNSNSLRRSINVDQRTRSTPGPPSSIIDESESSRHLRRSSDSSFVDQGYPCSGVSVSRDSSERFACCFGESVNSKSNGRVAAERPSSSHFENESTTCGGGGVSAVTSNEDQHQLKIGIRYLEEKIAQQRARIDELNDDIKKARHIRDDYNAAAVAAAAEVVTKNQFENVLKEFLNSSETRSRSRSRSDSVISNVSNVSNVSNGGLDSAITHYFTKCYDNLSRKVHQYDCRRKVSSILADNLEKDKTRLQNRIVELKSTRVRTNAERVSSGGVH